MTGRKFYCDNCGNVNLDDTGIKEITDKFRVKDEKIKETVRIRVCKKCGSEVYDETLEKTNEEKLYNKYREIKGLLLPSEIKSIRLKYDMSQSVFARLLGFGEKTMARYETGAIQDAAHDNLIRLTNDLSNMQKIFEHNKHRLTDKEREKVKSELFEDENEYHPINGEFAKPLNIA